MALTPWLRSPLTDLTGNLVTHQWHAACSDLEITLMECFEAYGKDTGSKKCESLLRDFKECSRHELQGKRTMAMRLERHRQHLAGERKASDKYAPAPKPESY